MYEDLSFLYGSGTYAIYLRKSRKDLDAEAMGEGETLSRHLDILKALAKRMELNVVKVYAEVVLENPLTPVLRCRSCSVMWRPVSMMVSWSLK